jgi:hypothetical protein
MYGMAFTGKWITSVLPTGAETERQLPRRRFVVPDGRLYYQNNQLGSVFRQLGREQKWGSG